MKKGLKLPTILIYLFLVVLTFYFISKGNFEFIGYAFVVGILYYLVLVADKKFDFPIFSIWLFAVWIASHMLGGAVHISGRRLYDILLVNIYNGGGEFLILKYDQLVHAYCYFAIAILVYYALKKYFKKDNEIPLMIFTILAAIGIGLLNEVVEFGMVLFADASEAVGGYYNTALDLVFNLIGAVFGAIFSSKFLD